jgi:hypothetical protein
LFQALVQALTLQLVSCEQKFEGYRESELFELRRQSIQPSHSLRGWKINYALTLWWVTLYRYTFNTGKKLAILDYHLHYNDTTFNRPLLAFVFY